MLGAWHWNKFIELENIVCKCFSWRPTIVIQIYIQEHVRDGNCKNKTLLYFQFEKKNMLNCLAAPMYAV